MPEGLTSSRYPTYPPEIEARRADYEQIARAFNLLTEIESQRVNRLLYIDLSTGENMAPESADLIGVMQEHLHRVHFSIDWLNPQTMLFLYVEMRLQSDYSRWQQEQEAEKEQDEADAQDAGDPLKQAKKESRC